jgi:hypothetical protein
MNAKSGASLKFLTNQPSHDALVDFKPILLTGSVRKIFQVAPLSLLSSLPPFLSPSLPPSLVPFLAPSLWPPFSPSASFGFLPFPPSLPQLRLRVPRPLGLGPLQSLPRERPRHCPGSPSRPPALPPSRPSSLPPSLPLRRRNASSTRNSLPSLPPSVNPPAPSSLPPPRPPSLPPPPTPASAFWTRCVVKPRRSLYCNPPFKAEAGGGGFMDRNGKDSGRQWGNAKVWGEAPRKAGIGVL